MMRFVRFSRSMEYVSYETTELSFAGNAFLPSLALVPLRQQSGVPAIPVVSAGERVREGQLIARGAQPESVHVHSPVPGVLRAFATVPLPDGTMGNAAIIQLSGSFDLLGRKEERFPWKSASESEILRVLEDRGVINTFDDPVPLASELRQAKKNGKKIVAVRLFDADPTCQLDGALMSFRRDAVLEGAALIAKACDSGEVCLVHAERRWQGPSIKELETLFQGRTLKLVRSSTRYPSGNARIIRALVAAEDRKREGHVLCVDAATAATAYDATVRNLPVVSRTVVVTGTALEKPAILNVRIGTPIGDIIEECGGFRCTPSRIVVNGLLAGIAIYDLDTPITKYTKSIHIMDADSCPDYVVTPCVHCGRCLQVCPAKIDPMRVVIGIGKAKHTPKLVESLDKCQRCGCCAVVCPSRIPLHHRIVEARERIRKGAQK